MVKLAGKVRIEFLDERGNLTRNPVEETNLIFNQTLVEILEASPNEVFSQLSGYLAKIVILEDATEPTSNNTNWTEIAEGYVPDGVNSPLWYESVSPFFGQLENRIDAVTVPRTFYSVGIRAINLNLCRTKLSLPCTQNPFEILRIFYQIQVLDIKQRLSSRFVRDLGGALFATKTCYHYVLGCSYADLPNQEYIDPLQPENLLIREPRFGVRTWDNSQKIENHYKYKENVRFQIRQSGISGDEDEFIGEIFNTFLVGLSNVGARFSNNFVPGNFREITQSAYRIEKYQRKIVNADPNKPVFQPPFQRIWTHRQGADKPFFDEVNPAVGTGYPSTTGTWSGKWPELYKFTIAQGGEVGTATYKFSKRLHLGFSGNSYTEKSVKCPFRNPNTPAALGMHGHREQDNDLLRFSNTEVVQYDLTGVTLLDLVDGAYKNWDATTSPSLGVTNLRQCAVLDKRIYCACRNTGLWMIDVLGNTVTRLFATPCYGVDAGNGRIYAMLDGGLRNSSDWGVTMPITYPGLTDGFWSRALFIKADPLSINADIAIVMTSPNDSNSRRVVWHSTSNGLSLDGPEGSYIYPWAASLDVSDGNSFWAINGYRIEFGSSATYQIGETFSKLVDYEGSLQEMYKINFYQNFLISERALIKLDGSNEIEYLEPDNSTTVLHLSGGICLFSTFLRQLFTDNSYCWEEYGWNGSAWAKDNAGTRVSHTTDQPLIQGLQIKWTNGNTPPSFYTGDFYTQGVLNGTWKDNATTIYYENFWYTRPVNFDTPIPLGIVIPPALAYLLPAAMEPTFLRIETDSINALSNFKINNIPVATIYTNEEPPGPNEITVDGVSGAVAFNNADVGKTFSGSYAWIGV